MSDTLQSKRKALADMLNGRVTNESLAMIKEQSFLGKAPDDVLKNPEKLKKTYSSINNNTKLHSEDDDRYNEEEEDDITAKLQKRLNEAKKNGGNAVSIVEGSGNEPKEVSIDQISALLNGGINEAKKISNLKSKQINESTIIPKNDIAEIDDYFIKEKTQKKPQQNQLDGLNIELLNAYIETKAREIAKDTVKSYLKEEMPKLIKIIVSHLKTK
jgi:hypothetical protein